MKTFKGIQLHSLNVYGQTYEVFFVKNHYVNNNGLAVIVMNLTDYDGVKVPEVFANLPVNVEATNFLKDPSLAFVKTWSENFWAEDLIAKTGIAESMNVKWPTGYSEALLYKFNLNRIPDMSILRSK